MNKAGRPVVVTGPSGAGKSTVCRRLRDRYSHFGISISATTRPRRGIERDGVHYHFLTPEDFSTRVHNGEFLEWEEVHGHQYGTLYQALQDALGTYPVVLLDIDPKGGLSMRAHYPEAVLIFLRPPSLEALEDRLRRRQEDPDEAITRRLQRTQEELKLARHYDLVVINNNLDETVDIIDAYIARRSKEDVSSDGS